MNIKSSHLEALQALVTPKRKPAFSTSLLDIPDIPHIPVTSPHSSSPLPLGIGGKRTTTLWGKLHTSRYARTEYFPKSEKAYHLFSRKLYRQIGRENQCSRRDHEFEHIQRRIGILDFVLSHAQWESLETVPEEVSYFCDQLKVPMQFLPAKTFYQQKTSPPTTRYFLDKFPLFLRTDPCSLARALGGR